MNRYTPLRRTKPMRRVSPKVAASRGAFLAVYAEVDRRSHGRCEVCGRRATDHHHTIKPRRSNHRADAVIHLCRACHDRCAAPYSKGRLIIWPIGHGQFAVETRYAR